MKAWLHQIRGNLVRDQRHHGDGRVPLARGGVFWQAKDQSGNAEGAEDAENLWGLSEATSRSTARLCSALLFLCSSSALSASSAFQTSSDAEAGRSSVSHRWKGQVCLALAMRVCLRKVGCRPNRSPSRLRFSRHGEVKEDCQNTAEWKLQWALRTPRKTCLPNSAFSAPSAFLYFARREMRQFAGRTSLSVRVKKLGERRTRTSVVRLDLTRVSINPRLRIGGSLASRSSDDGDPW